MQSGDWSSDVCSSRSQDKNLESSICPLHKPLSSTHKVSNCFPGTGHSTETREHLYTAGRDLMESKRTAVWNQSQGSLSEVAQSGTVEGETWTRRSQPCQEWTRGHQAEHRTGGGGISVSTQPDAAKSGSLSHTYCSGKAPLEVLVESWPTCSIESWESAFFSR